MKMKNASAKRALFLKGAGIKYKPRLVKNKREIDPDAESKKKARRWRALLYMFLT